MRIRKAARLARAENALRLIGRGGCENYTGPSTCRDDSGRTPDARYGAEKWCDACIALEALEGPK